MTTPKLTAGYIKLPVTVNPRALIAAAVASIQAQIPGYVPIEGSLDLIVIEECAVMVSTAAQLAAQMQSLIFEFAGQLFGIFPQQGVQATAPVTFTIRTSSGATIPAGTVVSYPLSATQSILFTVQNTINVPAGMTTGTGTLVCDNVGVFANTLPAQTCNLVTGIPAVASVATTATSSGGVAADTATSYLNRLSSELQLIGPRPILPSDFAALAPQVPGVYRACAIDGLNPGRVITNAHTTSTSETITCSTGAFTATDKGRTVTGTGIPSSSTITTVTSSTQIKISHAATATGTTVTLTLADLDTQQRFITVCGLTAAGAALSSTVTAALKAYLDARRENDFVVATIRPTFSTIDVTVTCQGATGVTTSAVQAQIAAALTNFLSPANWGGGNAQVPQWSTTADTVRYLDIANIVGSVPGVLYIPSSAGITLAIHGNSMASVDVALPGDAPVTRAHTLNITVN